MGRLLEAPLPPFILASTASTAMTWEPLLILRKSKKILDWEQVGRVIGSEPVTSVVCLQTPNSPRKEAAGGAVSIRMGALSCPAPDGVVTLARGRFRWGCCNSSWHDLLCGPG